MVCVRSEPEFAREDLEQGAVGVDDERGPLHRRQLAEKSAFHAEMRCDGTVLVGQKWVVEGFHISEFGLLGNGVVADSGS